MLDTSAGFAAQALAATEGLATPVAVVEERILERNLARMAAFARESGLKLRPHAKTHKSAFIARRQIHHGAAGLTAATLHEAEVFADAGVDDLFIAHPPVGEAKRRRLGALAERGVRLAVAMDDPDLVRGLPEGVEVMWEVDTGLHRVGTAPGEATDRAARVLPAGRLRGLFTHAGQSYAIERAVAARDEWQGLAESAALLREEGVEVRELSVGSSPTAAWAAEAAAGGITEMRPGTYVFGDANQVALGAQQLDDCALGVVATVVSTPERGRRVLDCGTKSISADFHVKGLEGWGMVLGHPDLRIDRLNEEHAVVLGDADLKVGDRVVVIPSHACTTANLHPALLFVGNGQPRWEPVAARGWN
ncbi:MAG TPA: alanine racemase [Candidatus Dormibacteraeota bacterium]